MFSFYLSTFLAEFAAYIALCRALTLSPYMLSSFWRLRLSCSLASCLCLSISSILVITFQLNVSVNSAIRPFILIFSKGSGFFDKSTMRARLSYFDLMSCLLKVFRSLKTSLYRFKLRLYYRSEVFSLAHAYCLAWLSTPMREEVMYFRKSLSMLMSLQSR